MNFHAIFRGKLAATASILLFCVSLPCVAADQPTVLVVAQDGTQLFYHRNGQPTDIEEVPKGTELTIESTSGERCFVTYKGKPAYIRRQFLLTRDEFRKQVFEAEQKAKGLVQYQGKWIMPDEEFRREQTAKRLVEYQGEWLTPAEKFRREQTAKGLIEYDGHWLTPEDKKTAIQKNLTGAVARGDSTRFQELLNANTDLIDATNSEGMTLLQVATAKQDESIVRALLERGADVNVRDKNGNTPLQIAASGGNTNLVMLLIATGADVNSRADNGQTPLFAAVTSSQKEVVELLMQHGAHLDATDANGRTALQLAIASNREAITELLRKEETQRSEQVKKEEQAKKEDQQRQEQVKKEEQAKKEEQQRQEQVKKEGPQRQEQVKKEGPQRQERVKKEEPQGQEQVRKENESRREQAAHELAEKLRAGVLTVPELVPIFRGMTKDEVVALLGRPNVVDRAGDEFQYYDRAYSVLRNTKDTILIITFHADVVSSVGLNREKVQRAD